MEKIELLRQIYTTDEFLEFSNDKVMEILKAVVEVDKPAFIANCLHMAYLNGYEAACRSMARIAEQGVSRSDMRYNLAIDFCKLLEDNQQPCLSDPKETNHAT